MESRGCCVSVVGEHVTLTPAQQAARRSFSDEQVRWLGYIRDHIAGSVSMEMADFQYAPFNQQGGQGKT